MLRNSSTGRWRRLWRMTRRRTRSAWARLAALAPVWSGSRLLAVPLGRQASALLAAVVLSLPAAAQDARVFRVAVDVGHTLAAPGAISARGRSELEFNRDLALRVAQALDRLGMEVVLINLDGAIESLQARPAEAAAAGADFLLSIHHDSVSEWELEHWTWNGRAETYNDRWAGHSLFVSRRNPNLARSLLCARTMGARLQRRGFVPTDKNARRREYADPRLAVHYYDDLVVLYRSVQPAVLFEAGVIKHRDEELLLLEPQRQTRMAEEIATGVAACLMAGR